jgi:chromosome segregation ATPase
LRETVQKNKQFIRDTDAKIETAEKKAREETELMNKRKEEQKLIEELREKYKEEKNMEEKIINANSQFKKYLESVVQENEEDFKNEIENLLNRHNTLKGGNAELQQQDVEVNRLLDKRREDFQREYTKLQNEQLMVNSEFHNQQMEFERLRGVKAELESKLTSAYDEREKYQSHIGIIGMAIEQLYQRALQSCRDDRRKQAMEDHTSSKFGHRDDLVLECIEERLNELVWIVEQCKNVESGKGPEKEVVVDGDVLDRVRFINYDDNLVVSPKGDSAPLGAISSQKLDKNEKSESSAEARRHD